MNSPNGLTSEAIQALCLASAPRNPWSRHPLARRVYLVFFVLSTLLVLVPLWAMIYLPRHNRPRKSWSLQRCLRVRWSRRLCGVVARCEMDYLGRNLEGNDNDLVLKFSRPVTIPPASSKCLCGHPAEALDYLHKSTWTPHFVRNPRRRWEKQPKQTYGFAPVKAFWYGQDESSLVALHFHGGGYLCGTAAETDLTSSIPKHLVKHSPIRRVLSVDYRLAPQAPWPLPLLDAISSYQYLAGIVDEKNIIISGDSAGAHLAMALTRWLRDQRQRTPRGLVLFSPWSDVGLSNSWGEAYHDNAECDTLDDTFGPFATSLLLRALPLSIMHTSPYLSPASLLLEHDESLFESFPPTFIVYGGAERLARSTRLLWSRLRQSLRRNDSVIDDELWEVPDSVHDFVIFPWHAEEAEIAYEKLNDWLGNLERGNTSAGRIQRCKPAPLETDSVFKTIGDLQDEGLSVIDSIPSSAKSFKAKVDWNECWEKSQS